MRNMITRIITSLIGLVVFFLVIFAGEAVFTGAIAVVTLFMLFEMYRSMKSSTPLIAVGFVNALLLLASIIFGRVTLEFATAACILIYMTAIVVFHGKLDFKEIGANALVTFFIAIFFGTMIKIYRDFSISAVLLVFVCAWTSDTGAYFTGRAIGRHKLIPRVSPKKTVEGAIGGVIVAGLCCMLYMYILKRFSFVVPGEAGYLAAFVIGIASSVFSMIGDLVASAIKRDCGVKDFGNVLPGHGGILDRFDSVIYITPVIYYFLVYIAG